VKFVVNSMSFHAIFIFSFSCSLVLSQFQHLTNQMKWYILYALSLSSIVDCHGALLTVLSSTCFPLLWPAFAVPFLGQGGVCYHTRVQIITYKKSVSFLISCHVHSHSHLMPRWLIEVRQVGQ
jgi:hypothetical protein